MAEQVDAVVVGMGPGGEEVAGRLAGAGLAVVGVESRLVGGECPYWGCVPSKMMIRAADSLAEGRRIAEVAGTSRVDPDWAPVARRIRDEATDNWDDTVAVKRFEGKGGRFVRGWARLTGPSMVYVEGAEFEATTAVVIATGTQPAVPPIPGLADTPYWTNRQAVETTEVPRSLAVIGGGAVGLEFAQVFARFGSRVTVIEAADRLLPLEEPEAGELIADVFRREALDVLVGARIARVDHDGETFRIEVAGAAPVQAERLLVATGRRADLGGLGVAAAGLDQSARFVTVDEHLRAGPRLWAVGDITGRGAFTHVAMYQARIAASDILGFPHEAADYRALPRVTFTDPEVGAVGLTEDQARARGITVSTALTPVPSSARGWIHKTGNDGLIKLVADRDSGVLVGATSAGPAGGEVLSALAVAVHGRVPISTLAEMIYAYPTFHRAIEDAVRGLQ
ncbi:MAG: NAD(P)/FAD-dependent oxidoreductase [Acidobacteriota bacterium]|nr:NAD(P)/FAD-dependent oxidoreductase [Acidobacteriota bacterium]